MTPEGYSLPSKCPSGRGEAFREKSKSAMVTVQGPACNGLREGLYRRTVATSSNPSAERKEQDSML
ncbi:hypothetical protein LJB63_18970, partial [[Eubacterium] rectale]|nr:hypothetical protein [Agathobacter rectalis]